MKHVLQIASQYNGSDKEEWQRVAKKFRLPYLDWCAAQGILLWTSCLCSSAAAAFDAPGLCLYSHPFLPSYCHRSSAALACTTSASQTPCFSTLPPSPCRAADYVKESGLPAFLNQPTLEVQTPTGKQTMPNPFLGYTIDRCGGGQVAKVVSCGRGAQVPLVYCRRCGMHAKLDNAARRRAG